MLDTIMMDQTVAKSLEEIEADASVELCFAATHDMTEKFGIRLVHLGAGCAIMAAKVDILAFNRVIGLGIDRPADISLLEGLVSAYEKAGVPRFFVQLSPQAEPNYLSGLLVDRGFRHYNNWVKLYRGVQPPPVVKTDLKVSQISRDGAQDFGDVFVTSFGWPAALAPFISGLVGRAGWRHYLAYDGSKPVATGALYVQGAYGWIDFASTLPDYRGRGAQSALVAQRIRDAAALGCRRLVVETAEETPERSAPSFRNMRRLGFEVAYVRPNYLYTAA